MSILDLGLLTQAQMWLDVMSCALAQVLAERHDDDRVKKETRPFPFPWGHVANPLECRRVDISQACVSAET